MDTKSIRCFCCVYQEKSINKAAKQLFITPQGLSKIINNLEEEINSKLFERSAKGVIPTETGKYLYSNCNDILRKLEEIEIGILRLTDTEKQFLIGFSVGVLNIFSFKKISELKNIYSNIKWEENLNSEIISKVKKGEIDLGIIIGNIYSEGIEKKDLFNISPDIIVYKGHRFYEKSSIDIKELENEPLITLNENFSSYNNIIQRCNDNGFTPNIVAKTMESNLIYRFVREKNGIGIDVNIHRDDIKTDNIKRIPIENGFLWNISIIYKKENIQNPILEQIIKYIENSIKK